MARTKTPHQAKKKQNDAELISGGAGDWIVKPNGKFFDVKKGKWILKCHGCKKTFYASRSDAKTHSDTCRKKVSRKNLKQNRS